MDRIDNRHCDERQKQMLTFEIFKNIYQEAPIHSKHNSADHKMSSTDGHTR